MPLYPGVEDCQGGCLLPIQQMRIHGARGQKVKLPTLGRLRTSRDCSFGVYFRSRAAALRSIIASVAHFPFYRTQVAIPLRYDTCAEFII